MVATANDVTRLPPELLRRGRFDELFFVDLPSAHERVEILAIHLRKNGRDPKQFPLDGPRGAARAALRRRARAGGRVGPLQGVRRGRDLADNDLANAIQETVPLYETYEERIKELRDWARHRARAASVDGRMVDLFTPT